MKRIARVWLIGLVSAYGAQGCDVPARRDTTFNNDATLFTAEANQANQPGAVEQSIGAVRTTDGELSDNGGNDLIYDPQTNRVYVVGTTQELVSGTDTNIVLAAFNPQGTLAASFNPDGNYYAVNQLPDANEFKAGVVSIKAVDRLDAGEEGIALAVDSLSNVGIGGRGRTRNTGTNQGPIFILFNSQGEPVSNFGPGQVIRLTDGFEGVATITGSFAGHFLNAESPLKDVTFDNNNLPFIVGQTTRPFEGATDSIRRAYHIRLTTGGILDNTFNAPINLIPINEGFSPMGITPGPNGYVTGVVVVSSINNAPSNFDVLPHAVVVDANNNYVVGGALVIPQGGGGPSFALIYKILESGEELDQSFNSGSNTFQLDGSSPIPSFPGNGNIATGAVAVDINESAVVKDLKVLDDGSIVAVGTFNGAVTGLPDAGRDNGFVLKLNASGVFFPGFNPSGAVLTNNGIAALGVTTPGLLLFGAAGGTDIDILPKSVCCDSDGKIIVISDVSVTSDQAEAFLVLSLNPDGTEDTAFNPIGLQQVYNGTIPNITYNASLEANQSPAFGFNSVNFVNVDQANYKGCAVDEDNSIFIGGPGTDELLLAFKLCGGEAPTGPIFTCPAEPGTFICALIDKYSGLCANNTENGNGNGSQLFF